MAGDREVKIFCRLTPETVLRKTNDFLKANDGWTVRDVKCGRTRRGQIIWLMVILVRQK